jgi:lambda family phage portal protein
MPNPFAIAARAALGKPVRRAYEAANISRLYADWITAYSRSADSETRYTLRTLRNRAREQVQNSWCGIRYWQLLGENIIGPDGIRYLAKNVTKEGKFFVAANRALKAAWNEAGRIENWDSEGKLTRIEQLSLAVSNWGPDGEILLRLFRGPDFGKFGFAVQLLDPDFLDDQLNEEATRSHGLIRQGVEMNARGQPTFYWLFRRHPFDTSTYFAEAGNADRHLRVPASDIIHAFIPVRPGQTRGVPHSAAIMTTLKMLDGYIESEMVAARAGAAKFGAIEDVDPVNAPMTRDVNAPQPPMPTEASPGTLVDLRGMAAKISLFNPEHPTSAFPNFTQTMSRFMAIGLGLAYSTLTGDHSNDTYSSMKVGLQPEHVHWRRFQTFVIDHVLERLFAEWLNMALLQGAIPGITDFDARRWRTHEWQPRGFPSPDPLKDAQADLMLVAANVETLTDIAGARGYDLEEQFEKRANEIALAKQYGLEIVLPIAAPKGTSDTVDQNDTGNNDTSGTTDSTDSASPNRKLALISDHIGALRAAEPQEASREKAHA